MNDGKEELDDLREAVREFLAAKSPETAVRAAMETGHDPAVLGPDGPPAPAARPGVARATTAATGSA